MTEDEEVQYYRNLSNKMYSEALDLMEKADEMWQTAEVLKWAYHYDKEGV